METAVRVEGWSGVAGGGFCLHPERNAVLSFVGLRPDSIPTQ